MVGQHHYMSMQSLEWDGPGQELYTPWNWHVQRTWNLNWIGLDEPHHSKPHHRPQAGQGSEIDIVEG